MIEKPESAFGFVPKRRRDLTLKPLLSTQLFDFPICKCSSMACPGTDCRRCCSFSLLAVSGDSCALNDSAARCARDQVHVRSHGDSAGAAGGAHERRASRRARDEWRWCKCDAHIPLRAKAKPFVVYVAYRRRLGGCRSRAMLAQISLRLQSALWRVATSVRAPKCGAKSRWSTQAHTSLPKQSR